MEDVDVVYGLQLSHSEEYATVVTTLESLPAETLTLEFAEFRLLNQEIKQHTSGNTSTVSKQESAAFGGSSRGNSSVKQKKFKCFFCQKVVHKALECPEKAKKVKSNAHVAEESKGVCFVSVGNPRWFVDSGASEREQSGSFRETHWNGRWRLPL